MVPTRRVYYTEVSALTLEIHAYFDHLVLCIQLLTRTIPSTLIPIL